MGKTILQNQTAEALTFDMVQSSDSKTPATGLSPTVVVSKNGGSYLTPSGAISEVGNGTYKIAGHATDANTLGILKIYATASGADAAKEEYAVVAYDSRNANSLGLAYLGGDAFTRLGAPVNASISADIAANKSVVDSIKTVTDKFLFDASNFVKSNAQVAADSTGVTTLLGRLTSARAGYLDNLNNIVSNIWAAVTDSSGVTTLLSRLSVTRTDKLDSVSTHSALDVWLVSLNASFTANSLGQWFARLINNALGTDYRMKVSTDVHSSGITVASVSDKSGFAPNAAQNAAAVRTELEPELAHLDEDISSRSTPDDLNVTVNPTAVTVNPTPVTVNPTPVTVNPTPVTVEPTLTTEQAAQLAAASTVGALIEDGAFSEAAMVNAGGEAQLDDETLGKIDDIHAKTQGLGTAQLTVTSPVSSDGKTLHLTRGDDYYHDDGRALEWENDSWPDLSGASCTLTVGVPALLSVSGVAVSSTRVRVELPASQSAQLPNDSKRTPPFELLITLGNGHKLRPVLGHVVLNLGTTPE